MAQFTDQERMKYIRQHGRHCLAYSTLQPRMSYFDVRGKGFLAYVLFRGTHFVLSNPVCCPSDRYELISSFLETARRPFFVQIDEQTASILHDDLHFRVNCLGVENTIRPHDFQVTWKVRRDLKRWLSSLSKRDVAVHNGQGTVLSDEVCRVSREWLRTKTVKREMEFLARPFNIASEPDVRRYYAMLDGQLIAFCTFDPCYRGNSVVAFALNHMRSGCDAPNGILDYIIVHAIRDFEAEGVEEVELGLSPLHGRITDRYRGAFGADFIANLLYTKGSRFYGFKQIGFHKDRFKPEKRQVYVASQKRVIAWDIFKLLKVTKIL